MNSNQQRAIELVSLSDDKQRVDLTMTEAEEWDGSPERLKRIQARVNDYLAFALDGQFARDFPELQGKTLRIDLVTTSCPDQHSMKFLDRVTEICQADGIEFHVTVVEGLAR